MQCLHWIEEMCWFDSETVYLSGVWKVSLLTSSSHFDPIRTIFITYPGLICAATLDQNWPRKPIHAAWMQTETHANRQWPDAKGWQEHICSERRWIHVKVGTTRSNLRSFSLSGLGVVLMAFHTICNEGSHIQSAYGPYGAYSLVMSMPIPFASASITWYS